MKKPSSSPTGTGFVESDLPFRVERSLEYALAPLNPWVRLAIADMKKQWLKKQSRKPVAFPPAVQEIIDRASAELVEEILALIRENQGIPMFVIIERKMKRLVKQLAGAPKPSAPSCPGSRPKPQRRPAPG